MFSMLSDYGVLMQEEITTWGLRLQSLWPELNAMGLTFYILQDSYIKA
jgi:hypothetical protein